MNNVDSSPSQPLYKDALAPVSVRVDELLGRMTLEEKTDQMALVEKNSIDPETAIDFDPSGTFAGSHEASAEVGLVFLVETPYAEGFGDRADLALCEADIALLERMRGRCQKLAVVSVTGRPLIITEQLPLMDALVVAWLPGTEGQGVADVLFGDVPFGGKLPYTWPRDMSQFPLDNVGGGDPLFPFSFGLS